MGKNKSITEVNIFELCKKQIILIWIVYFIIPSFLVLAFFSFIWFFVLIFTENVTPIIFTQNNQFILILILLCISLVLSLLFLFFSKIAWIVQYKIQAVKRLMKNTTHTVEEISEILFKLKNIYNLMLIIKHMRILSYILWGKEKRKLKKYVTQEISEIFIYLSNLRSDLQIRLDEQKKSLEWAKSEVESNIKWSNDLEQVSEIQKIRLDRQIEQFE